MKKALSLILCLLMVFSSFSGLITASAEETGKNLWTDISVDDFGTKDTNACPISEFAEGKNNYGKNFVVKGAYHTSFYIEMPELEENSIYNLSFKYDNHIIASSKGKINNINIVTEEEMAQITDVDGIKLPSTATTIGSALELDKGQYTDLSATFTTGATKTKHYLYFRTGYAYWFYLCDFKLVKTGEVEPDTNVLSGTTAADWGAKSWSSVSNGTESAEGGSKILVSSAMHQKIFTVVKLEANTTYDFSFNWKAVLGKNYGSAAYPSEIYVYPISKVGDIMNAEMESGASANSGKWDTKAVFHPLSGDLTDEDNLLSIAVDRANNKEAALKAEWTNLATEFTTTDDTEYAILIHFNCNGTNDANKIHLSDFNLSPTVFYNVEVLGGTANLTSAKKGTEITITATPTSSEIFNYWEVISGGIALSDMFSKTTTFTMPGEDVSVKAVFLENLWANLSADDWFTRQVSTKVDDPLTLEEKKMTDVYPEKFTYTEDGSFSLQTAGSKFYYVKLPELAKNTEYTLSLDYSATKANASLTPNLYKAILMPKSAFTNQYTWNGYGDMLSGRGFLGAYDVCLNKVLSENELNSTLTYDFNSKTKTEYYLFFHFSNIGNITYSNFKLTECPLYGITVDGGTANLTAAKKGAEVTITANEPQNGMVFDHFEVVSGGVTLADPYSETTTFTMGGSPVSVNAVYREYGAKIVYVDIDGNPYPDAANLVKSKIEIAENADGTNTATLTYNILDGVNSFLGWYTKDGTALGSDLSLTYNPEEIDVSNITAKILCRNALTGAASFEGYENGTNMRVEPVATGVAPYADKWGLFASGKYEQENIGFYIKTTEAKESTYYTNVGFNPETSSFLPENERTVGKYLATPHSGNSMLELTAWYRSFVRKMDGLKPNTNYTLSMYVLTPDEYNFLSAAVIAGGYLEKSDALKSMSNRTAQKGKVPYYGYYQEPREEDFFETNVRIKDKSAVQTWKKISFEFTTGDNTDSLYLYLVPRNCATWYSRCPIFIDDMVCIENVSSNAGNAMRAAASDVPQALRYKFAVPNKYLESLNGKAFKQMGILAAETDKLNGADLTKDAANVKDAPVSQNNYQYKENDTNNTYVTAALYNIGRTNGKLNYGKYASKYSARPYFVYADDEGNESIVYGETVSVSIFEVMYAIRDVSTNQDDINAVNGMLENETLRKLYADWQPDDAWNIENPNAPTEYDYSFAILGDMQYTTQFYPDDLHHPFDWLINNKDAKNLQYVVNVGDITNGSTNVEFETVSAQLLRLKEAGIDQSLVRGNHDKLADYDKYITAEKFIYGNGEFETYNGTMKTYYQKLTIGGIKYMIMVLDYFPSTAEIEWAKAKIDANPDYNVIVNTHGYLDSDMQLIGEDLVYDVEDRVDADGNPVGGHAGQYIHDNLVVPCSNVVMVICGHELSDGPEIKTLTREDGSTAVQMLVDFQQHEFLDLRSYGMIAMLYFSNGGETVTVEWFSSIKNEYYKDKYQYTFNLTVIK